MPVLAQDMSKAGWRKLPSSVFCLVLTEAESFAFFKVSFAKLTSLPSAHVPVCRSTRPAVTHRPAPVCLRPSGELHGSHF